MFGHDLAELTRVIQLAIAPVFVLTAVGTIINALNIRLGRVTDRRRALELELVGVSDEDARLVHQELGVVAQRIRFVYMAILFSVLAGLFVCLLIAGAFLAAFVAVNLTRLVAGMFILAMLALIVCLLLFLREIVLAVSAPRYVRRAISARRASDGARRATDGAPIASAETQH